MGIFVPLVMIFGLFAMMLSALFFLFFFSFSISWLFFDAEFVIVLLSFVIFLLCFGRRMFSRKNCGEQ
ncbi:MAG: hypothetical protein LBO02_01150 [Holosporaceae bacterium]|nr:hypothetical protein [Holosporaceae bacterium]